MSNDAAQDRSSDEPTFPLAFRRGKLFDICPRKREEDFQTRFFYAIQRLTSRFFAPESEFQKIIRRGPTASKALPALGFVHVAKRRVKRRLGVGL